MTDKKRIAKIGVLLLLGAALLLAVKHFNLFGQLQSLLIAGLNWIKGVGPAGPAIFILFYIVLCVLLIPGSVLTAGAGVLFGVALGTVYVSIASVAGATCAFLIGRYLARAWVARKIEGNPKFKAIDEAVAREGWKIVGLTRLSPVFPFTLLNYAYGLTKVSLRDYVLASWIAMLPGTVLYVYLGSLLGDLAKVGVEKQSKSPTEWAFYIFGLAITIAVTVYITRVARKALAKRVA